MTSLPPSPSPSSSVNSSNMQETEKLVLDLINPDLREEAFIELAKKRKTIQDLGPLLWSSFGTIAIILEEILSVYPAITSTPPALTDAQSNRICNVLTILQCVASHPETKTSFLNAEILMYLYPFMKFTSHSRPFEYLRLTSLGVVCALVKVPSEEVINYLTKSEVIPFCLTTMETGSEISKSVATFVIRKIMEFDAGLNYVCSTSGRFFALIRALDVMVVDMAMINNPSGRLLKHTVQCYLLLSRHPMARDALRNCLPLLLRNGTFARCLQENPETGALLNQMLWKVDGPPHGMVQTGWFRYHHGFA